MKTNIRHIISLLLCMTVLSITAQEHQVIVRASECAAAQTYTLPDGAALILKATPAEDSRFVAWSDGNTDNPRTVTVTEDVAFTAVFAHNGDISSSDKYKATVYAGDCTQPFIGEFNRGALLKIVAEPKEGYQFKQWSDGNAENPRLVSVTSDVELHAEFEPYVSHETLYDVTVIADECGTSFNRQFYGGTKLVLDATPQDGSAFVRWSDGNTDNPRNVIVTGNATFTAVFEKKELPSDITLQENESADYYTQFANDYNGQRVNTATLNRQFTQGKWATLCLPFNVNKAMMMSLGLYNRVFAFRYAQQLDDETIQVFFVPAQSIEAGKGYIVNPNAKLAAKTSFVFPNVTINTDSDNGDITTLTGYNDGTGRGNLFLVGTLRTGTLQGSTAGNTYLGLKDNQLYYPNSTSGTPMRAYRAVFRSGTPVNASRLRIIADGETVSELQVVGTAPSDWSDKSDPSYTPARKYIDNGILYIERNGITYTAQGQRLD